MYKTCLTTMVVAPFLNYVWVVKTPFHLHIFNAKEDDRQNCWICPLARSPMDAGHILSSGDHLFNDCFSECELYCFSRWLCVIFGCCLKSRLPRYCNLYVSWYSHLSVGVISFHTPLLRRPPENRTVCRCFCMKNKRRFSISASHSQGGSPWIFLWVSLLKPIML